CSRTIRTARSRTSGEYLGHFFFVFSIAPFSQEVEPPEIPGRFTAARFVQAILGGLQRVDQLFLLIQAAYNLTHMRTLAAKAA
ncbi:hypothetical protein AB3X86_36600, partial [Paraburkholderia sp. BR14374]